MLTLRVNIYVYIVTFKLLKNNNFLIISIMISIMTPG